MKTTTHLYAPETEPRAGAAVVFALAAAICAAWMPEALAGDAVRANLPDIHAIASKEQAKSPYAKPGAPARLLSPPAYELSVGDRLSLELELGIHPAGLTTVSLSTDSGLSLTGQQLYQLEGQQQVVMPLEVTADFAELGYIHIHIEHRSVTGQITARALAVAMDSRSKALPLLRKAAAPKPYVEMQATEVIR
ncbi:MAG TPA: hypothetical protein VIC26_14130 [Marinagarivorans sp.]